MIILITGTPGSGKSLYAVGALLNGQFKDRPKFVNGIPDLLLEHTPISDKDVEAWYKGGEPNEETGAPAFNLIDAVFCIDEVQRIARPRSPSAPAPEWIKRLEVHRHSGCDFIIITQHPQQIDAHIRRLVGRHIHVRRTWALNAAIVYEWDSVSNLSNLKQAQSKVWRYPKRVFELYKSSEKHTKAGGRVPLVVWVVLATALAFPFVGWNAISRTLHRFTDTGQAAATPPSMARPAGASNPQSGKVAAEKGPLTVEQYIDQYKPRIEGMMHTAPVYDAMTVPKTVPLPAACLSSDRPSWVKLHGGPCGCYTQTGQRYDTTQAMCVQYVRNAVFFPFLEPPGVVQSKPKPVVATEPAPVRLASTSEPVFATESKPVLPPPEIRSTVSRDAEVLAFMRKREYIK